jgi:hypothetical protein
MPHEARLAHGLELVPSVPSSLASSSTAMNWREARARILRARLREVIDKR